jgi:hypothetical protein
MNHDRDAEAMRRFAAAGDWHAAERLAARRGHAALFAAIRSLMARLRAALARCAARR